MRIDKNEKIAGQPIKLARDLAKELARGSGDAMMNVTHITRWILQKGSERLPLYDPRYLTPPKVDLARGQAFLDEMLARGWLEPAKGHGDIAGYYECSDAGRTLALASLLKPIPRTKAEKIVADLVERARAVNASPDLLCWVKELRVFGSYITNSPDLGDVDIAYELERRPVADDKWVEANERRAAASGKQIAFLGSLYYGMTEVMLMLKNRNQYLSLHDMDELAKLKIESREIYKR